MQAEPLTLSQDAYNAYLLTEVIAGTAPPGESAAAARLRAAAIITSFQTFDPADPVEAMIACHCISLRAMLAAAMRDAANLTIEPLLLSRLRLNAMAIGKQLQSWMGQFDTRRARTLARAEEAAASRAKEASAAPVPKGAVPKGAVPEGAVPEGAVPGGAMSEGAMSEGRMPEGFVPVEPMAEPAFTAEAARQPATGSMRAAGTRVRGTGSISSGAPAPGSSGRTPGARAAGPAVAPPVPGPESLTPARFEPPAGIPAPARSGLPAGKAALLSSTAVLAAVPDAGGGTGTGR